MITNAVTAPPIAGSGSVLEEDEETAEFSGDTTTVKIGMIRTSSLKLSLIIIFDWGWENQSYLTCKIWLN